MFFNNTIRRAAEIGMKPSLEKTGMLLISDSVTYTDNAYIITNDGRKLEANQETLKILGFVFGKEPNVRANV